jgi:hypothetical protein
MLHLPLIDANMSISGPARSFSSAATATAVIETDINAMAATRQQARMKLFPKPKSVQSAVFDPEAQ